MCIAPTCKIISALTFVAVLQACGGGPSARLQQDASTPPSSGAATVQPTTSPSELELFEQSPFCEKYGCANPKTWALNTGATNHSYRLNLTPDVTLEVPTKGREIEHYGLVFYERDRLDSTQLAVIDELVAVISENKATEATRRFVRAQINEPVEQIRLAKSTTFGRYKIWAGSVGGDKVVSIEPAPPLSAAPSPGVVPFKVTARSLTTLVLLVDRRVSNDDLATLIRTIRKARIEDHLADLLPATTAGGVRGPYAVVNLFVMSDPAWATQARLERFLNPAKDMTVEEREFGGRIRAYYFFTSLGNEEEGSLGYAAEDHKYTESYTKLF